MFDTDVALTLSGFYERHAKRILLGVLLTFPVLYVMAESLPSDNDVEAWLPRESAVRAAYEEFKLDFGAEELVVVGLRDRAEDDPVVEALASRIERLPSIRTCWTPARMRTELRALTVPEDEIDERMRNVVVSSDGTMVGLLAVLSPEGLQDRAGTAAAIREQIDYCLLDEDDVHLAGAPVVVAELDRLGSRDNNKQFFFVTLAISLGLLYWCVRNWKVAFSMLGCTVWAINATLAVLYLSGGHMNFITSALSVMVMVFTMAIAIHFVHYYRNALGDGHPLDHAFALAWKPCCLATLTTIIGLMSLFVSEVPPVVEFGFAASIGCGVALFTGLLITPAILTWCPNLSAAADHEEDWFSSVAHWLLDRRRVVAASALGLVLLTAAGVTNLKSRIDPLDFLPRDGKVLTDVMTIERDLISGKSVECVVDFGEREAPFAERLREVRRLEDRVRSHPAIRNTISAATFFPERFPEDPLALASLLNRVQNKQGENDYVAGGQRLWRISARIDIDAEHSRKQILADLREELAGEPISFTGISPLLEHAQHTIFQGFWESFATAFFVISAVMIVSLRSLKAGLVAMVPNLTPICIVFGTLGWIGTPIDIGMMMTASIALGIAVDGTFHLLVRYEASYRETRDSATSARVALLRTGAPIFEAATIASLGMLALTFSRFAPTARFGYMMATLMLAALVGDLVLLPALLSLRPSRRRAEKVDAATPPPSHEGHDVQPPHFSEAGRRRDEQIATRSRTEDR